MSLALACSCGKQFDVPEAHAGRRVKCPSCGALMDVPAVGGQPARPRRRWPLLGLGVLLLALVGGGLAWWLWPREAGSDGPLVADVDLIPGNAQGFTSVRVAELWAMPAVRGAIDEARAADPTQPDLVTELDRLTGLKPEEIERLHAVGLDLDSRLAWLVVRSVEPLDRQKMLARLKGRTVHLHQGRRFHVGKLEDDEVAYHLAGPNVLVVSNQEGMKRCLDQAVEPVKTGQLEPVLAQMEGRSQVLLGWAPKPGTLEDLQKSPQLKDLPGVKLLRASAVVEKDVVLDLWLSTANAAEARKAQQWWLGWQKKLNDPLTGWLARALIAGMLKIDAKLLGQIAKLKPEVKGNEIGLRVKSDPGSLVKALNTAAKQMSKR